MVEGLSLLSASLPFSSLVSVVLISSLTLAPLSLLSRYLVSTSPVALPGVSRLLHDGKRLAAQRLERLRNTAGSRSPSGPVDSPEVGDGPGVGGGPGPQASGELLLRLMEKLERLEEQVSRRRKGGKRRGQGGEERVSLGSLGQRLCVQHVMHV